MINKILCLICCLACTLFLFQSAYTQNNDYLYQVQQNGQLGYIDRTGKIIIKPQFDYASKFSEGLASVEIGVVPNAKTDYRDKNGVPIVAGKIGYIDTKGNFVIKPQFAICEDFSEGLASVTFDSSERQKWGYIDKSGKIVLPTKDYYTPAGFHDGLAQVTFTNSSGTWLGYMNKTGKIVIQPKYFEAGDFSEGLAPVKDSYDSYIYFIDTTGKVVLKTKCFKAGGFSEGLSSYKNPFSFAFSSLGYINHDGKKVFWKIRAFTYFYRFSEGLARVAIENYPKYKYGYIDRTGKVVIPVQFDEAEDFLHGLARVQVASKVGYIDKTGKYIWPLQE